MTRALIASLVLLAGAPASATSAALERPAQACPVEQRRPAVEVVFVLDTTGSMGGLIEGAKQKIWSIATAIAQAQPAPDVRMGLIGYRDRGDDYVTRVTPMTEDIDAVYSDLMTFRARGGGDAPESVNEALFEAVNNSGWSTGAGVLRIVYLVGDAPPKMGYDDDVKYRASCRIAAERGIIINTVQCGSMSGTREVWLDIAQHAKGEFAAIPQDGGVRRCATPYDEEIAGLEREMASLMVDYGDRETKLAQSEKRDRADKVAQAAPTEAAADRAVYNMTASGGANRFGRQELVSDIAGGRVALDDVKEEELPEAYQAMTRVQRRAAIVANQARRDAIGKRMAELAASRAAFQAEQADDAPQDGFDLQVRASLSKQAISIGLTVPLSPAASPARDPEKTPESVD